MPIYEYRCDSGHTFEALQRMSDDPLSSCEVCEASARRVMSPVAVHFKGSGFYTTDYGRAKTQEGASGESKDSSDSGSGTGSSPETKGGKSESSSNGSSSSSSSSKAGSSSD